MQKIDRLNMAEKKLKWCVERGDTLLFDDGCHAIVQRNNVYALVTPYGAFNWTDDRPEVPKYDN